jgi:hypothetical protein
MAQCRCETKSHDHHLGRKCENKATEPDGYCRPCHEEAGKEFQKSNQHQPPLQPPLPPSPNNRK